jgi:hypothetical protein
MSKATGADLVRKDSIEELCGHRARALQLYRQALDTLDAAMAAHKLACAGGHTSNDFLRNFHYTTRNDKFDAAAQKGIDHDMWRHFIIGTPLGSLMDKEEKAKFEASLRDNPPEVTPDNVFATMARLAGDAALIFRRGLVNAFRSFCGDFKSHDGFKIGRRFVVTGLMNEWGLNQYRADTVQDMDRCMHVLDGKPAPEYQQGICAALRDAQRDRAKDEAATEYWRVRFFRGNGNAHFYPLRADLVERANRLIAEHYGETLGAGHAARHAA